MDVFRKLERPSNQPNQNNVQAGVDMTSFVSYPDRYAAFDLVQPNRRPANDFGGVDETPLLNSERIRLLEIPSKPRKNIDEQEVTQAPHVITPLQPIETDEGNPVVLTAKIDGTPMPNVSLMLKTNDLIIVYSIISSLLGSKTMHPWLRHHDSQHIMIFHRNLSFYKLRMLVQMTVAYTQFELKIKQAIQIHQLHYKFI